MLRLEQLWLVALLSRRRKVTLSKREMRLAVLAFLILFYVCSLYNVIPFNWQFICSIRSLDISHLGAAQ